MSTIVIDASIVSKWYLPSEEHSDIANKMLQDYVLEKINLIAPTILDYEMQNILLLSVQRLRLKEELALENLENYRELEISTFELEGFYNEAFEIARKYKLTSCDSSYVALALKHNFSFYTADKKLVGKVHKDISLVKYISDY